MKDTRQSKSTGLSGYQEQLIYAITGGKRNCLTRKLYDGPRTEGCGCEALSLAHGLITVDHS